jgi:hypothetical protein
MAWARGGGNGGNDNSDCGDGGSTQRIFWLDGMAGTGKSTIARTVARRCSDDGLLGATFFFSRGGGELETARTFVTTLAVQLARRHQLLRAAICGAVRAQPNIAAQLLSDQWRNLVLKPCGLLANAAAQRTRAHPTPAPLVLVVDALDECKAPAEVEFVLELLSETLGIMATPLRILVTSRPEITVRAGLDSMNARQRRHVILHHVQPSVINCDIKIFFEHKLASAIRYRPLLPGLTDEEVLQRLVIRADGLFIWAATASRYIKEGGPHARSRLDTIVGYRVSSAPTSPESKLDEIYTSVLRSALRDEWTGDEHEQFCRLLNDVLGTIAVLFLSLSALDLAALLFHSENDVLEVMWDLHSIFDVPKDRCVPIRPHHASVRDFLLSSERCTDKRFWVDERQAHTRVARQCLLLMTKTLVKNICGLNEPSVLRKSIHQERLNACIPASLRYACRYWVLHVKHSHNEDALRAEIEIFLFKHLLHWLEVLNLIDKLSDGIEMIRILYALFVSGREPMANTELWLTKGEAMRHVAPVFAACGCETFCTLQRAND